LAHRHEIAVFGGLIFGKTGPKPDFETRSKEIRPFLAAIFPEKAYLGEIAAQNAAIITGGKRDCG